MRSGCERTATRRRTIAISHCLASRRFGKRASRRSRKSNQMVLAMIQWYGNFASQLTCDDFAATIKAVRFASDGLIGQTCVRLCSSRSNKRSLLSFAISAQSYKTLFARPNRIGVSETLSLGASVYCNCAQCSVIRSHATVNRWPLATQHTHKPIRELARGEHSVQVH